MLLTTMCKASYPCDFMLKVLMLTKAILHVARSLRSSKLR